MKNIILKGVSYTYPSGALALDGVNLTIASGEQIAVIGQNGAGKTTLAKLINGLLKPASGDVFVGDVNTKDSTTARIARSVGYVFQNPDEQIFHSTVGAEVRYGIKRCKQKKNTEQFVQEVLRITGMNVYETKNPFDLPLSVRKFVTIAAVLAMDPDVLILDEPTAGQDLKGKSQLVLLLQWLREKEKTVILITHDMEFVAEQFHKIIVMADKRVMKIGTPQEVFWDLDLLKKADLEQPYVSALCKDLGIAGAVDIEMAAKCIFEKWKMQCAIE